jgi:hypothetical protein
MEAGSHPLATVGERTAAMTGDREACVPRFHRPDTLSEIRDYRSKHALLPYAGVDTPLAA